MGSQQENDNFVIGLEHNAFSSLEHGIEHFLIGNDTDLKFTVLHVFHAVELLFKARLAKEHPLLLLTKPEDDARNPHTADYQTVVKRLKKVGVEFDSNDLPILESLRKTRNDIEHSSIHARREDIEKYIGGAIRLLDKFVKKELDIQLRDRIKPNIYFEMEQAVYKYNERQKRIKERMTRALPITLKDQLNYQTVVCDECGDETVYVPDPESQDGTVRCYNCNARFYLWFCERCNELTLTDQPHKSNGEDPDLCDACWTNIFANND